MNRSSSNGAGVAVTAEEEKGEWKRVTNPQRQTREYRRKSVFWELA